MNINLRILGEAKHILRQAQIKLLKDSQYIGGLVDMIEALIEETDNPKEENDEEVSTTSSTSSSPSRL